MRHGSVGEARTKERAPRGESVSNFGFRISDFLAASPASPVRRTSLPFPAIRSADSSSPATASGPGVLCRAIVVSLASYCAGLVINDLADFSEDLRDRPGRPLPSGVVSRRAAVALALSLFVVIAIAAAAIVSRPS